MEKTSKDLDQFYTNIKVSKFCMKTLSEEFKLEEFFLLEPSAGTGSFSDLFHENSLAIDIDPKKDYIEKIDFLTLNNDIFNDKRVFTIGNPPFGKNSSLAIKFFNKAAEFSEYIGFVVPKTFKKISVINKLNLNFSLIIELEIPLDSFIFEGNSYSVPCVFQVWKKSSLKREIIKTKTLSDYFEFTDKENADFAVRRVGGLAGKVIENFDNYKESSHYFIKAKENKTSLVEKLKKIYSNLNELARNSAGNPSLSKHELIITFEKTF